MKVFSIHDNKQVGNAIKVSSEYKCSLVRNTSFMMGNLKCPMMYAGLTNGNLSVVPLIELANKIVTEDSDIATDTNEGNDTTNDTSVTSTADNDECTSVTTTADNDASTSVTSTANNVTSNDNSADVEYIGT